jgi:hypothetical protein
MQRPAGWLFVEETTVLALQLHESVRVRRPMAGWV